MKRASTKIKGWLAERRISVITLARAAGIKRETMSDTITMSVTSDTFCCFR